MSRQVIRRQLFAGRFLPVLNSTKWGVNGMLRAERRKLARAHAAGDWNKYKAENA